MDAHRDALEAGHGGGCGVGARGLVVSNAERGWWGIVLRWCNQDADMEDQVRSK